MSNITFADKVKLEIREDIPEVNKLTAENVNEIKTAVNSKADTTAVPEVLNGTSAPTSDIGKVGDIYIQTSA